MSTAKLLSKGKEGKLRLHVTKTTPAMLNTYRRMIINKVPAMAIDEVEFIENSSAVYDEMLAHRLGLIVLKTDTESYFQKEKCKCKGAGCARCTLNLTLEAVGPCTVYAEQLKSADPSVVPVHGKAIVVKLLEGQKLKFVATAVLGTGKEHIKFSPGLVYYQGYPTIKIGKGASADIAQVCPTKVFSADGGKLKVKDLEACILCNACVDESDGAVEVSASKEDFIVTLEPWGQLSAKEIIENTSAEIDEQLSALSEQIKKIK